MRGLIRKWLALEVCPRASLLGGPAGTCQQLRERWLVLFGLRQRTARVREVVVFSLGDHATGVLHVCSFLCNELRQFLFGDGST